MGYAEVLREHSGKRVFPIPLQKRTAVPMVGDDSTLYRPETANQLRHYLNMTSPSSSWRATKDSLLLAITAKTKEPSLDGPPAYGVKYPMPKSRVVLHIKYLDEVGGIIEMKA